MASASDTPPPVGGEAFALGSSRQIAARLEPLTWPTVVLRAVEDGRELVRAEVTAMRPEPRLGSLPSQVVLPGGWRFVTGDHDGLDALMGPGGGSRRHRWEAFHPRLALVVVATLAAGYAIWLWGIGLLVAVAVAMTPTSFVEAIDEGNLAALDRTLFEPSTLAADERARAQTVFDHLVAVAPPAPFGDYRLRFRALPAHMGPNAFALPGGTVVISDALVERFPDDDVVAGVLGHEIAHVSETHSLAQMYRALSTYLLIVLIAGDVGPILEEVMLEGQLLLSLSFSRAHEAEADRIGIEMAAAAGYDPAGLARFFLWLAQNRPSGSPGWLSTHPASADRVEAIEEQIQALPSQR